LAVTVGRWPSAVGSYLALAVAAGCADIEVAEDVVYDARFAGDTALDVYVPGDAAGPRPAVVLVHGGGWSAGSKGDMKYAARRFARAGYVAASVGYRLIPDGAFPASSRDVACALSFLRANAAEHFIDPDRIATYGYSAGAHLISLQAVAGGVEPLEADCDSGPTGPPAAVISGAGPQDLRSYRDWPVLTDYLGGDQSDAPETWALASPITHVDAGEPPFLLIHGTLDPIVGVDQSRAMRDALAAAGNDVSLLELRGAGHLGSPSPAGSTTEIGGSIDRNEAWIAVFDFLDRTVGAP
jgi:acetyl esterase/lipase